MTLIEEMTSNDLTWFEEWFLFFEGLWFCSVSQWVDVENAYSKYDTHALRRVSDAKCQIVLSCRSSWPTYVSYEEDHALCKEKWKVKYENKRVVQWDDINVPFMYKPSMANKQHLTYSSYYGMNCAKGGVFLQLCGWIGVASLWVGTTSDLHYQENNGIFKRQEAFTANDLINGVIIPFLNILPFKLVDRNVCNRFLQRVIGAFMELRRLSVHQLPLIAQVMNGE